jgi:hypothetical protein
MGSVVPIIPVVWLYWWSSIVVPGVVPIVVRVCAVHTPSFVV